MVSTEPSTVALARVPPERVPAVLRFLFAAAAEDAVTGGLADTVELWAAERGGRLVGAAGMSRPLGRTVEVLPPRVVAGEPAATGDALLDHVHQRLRGTAVRFAYAFVDQGNRAAQQSLTRFGYAREDDVLILTRSLDDIPGTWAAPPSAWHPWQAVEESRWHAVVAATRAGSQEFARLGERLPLEDLLANYAATGGAGREHWRIFRQADRDVGCALLAVHPARQLGELVYLGLQPDARGRGWGRALVRHALWQAYASGCRQLVLAVTAGNDPAIAAYAAAGCVVRDRRQTWLRAA